MYDSGLVDIIALVAYELETIPEIQEEWGDIICPECRSLNPPEAMECYNCYHSFNN